MIGKILFYVMFWCARLLYEHVAVLSDDDDMVKGIVMTVNPMTSTDDEEKMEVTLKISVR